MACDCRQSVGVICQTLFICIKSYQCKVALMVGFGMRHARIGFPLLLNQGLRTVTMTVRSDTLIQRLKRNS